MNDYSQIFAFLFLVLGPFKVLGPFSKMTRGTVPAFTRKLAFLSILYATIALILAAVLGENVLRKFGIPLPILAISGGLILFLVALTNIINQFSPPDAPADQSATPSLRLAMNPLAFPIIVTPYGIAAVIIFLALSPDLNGKLIISAIIVCIMLVNLIFMLIYRHIEKLLSVALPILGAILGVIQVSLGLMIIYNNIKVLLNSN